MSFTVTAVPLASGRSAFVPSGLVDRFVGMSPEGYRVIDSEIGLIALTDCCAAAVTGCIADDFPVICCKGCYVSVEAVLGSPVEFLSDAAVL